MITKERLEELIKEKAEIYYIINKTFIAGYSSISEIMSYKLNEPDYYIVDDNCLCLMKIQNNEEDYCVYAWKLQELFETKEEAEWELEFGNITRTETLRLPSWEEVCDGCITEFCFIDTKKGKHNVYISDEGISITSLTLYEDRFWNKLTKENYIEACKICKKLFLGEEV